MMFMPLKILEEETTCIKKSESNLCCKVLKEVLVFCHVQTCLSDLKGLFSAIVEIL